MAYQNQCQDQNDQGIKHKKKHEMAWFGYKVIESFFQRLQEIRHPDLADFYLAKVDLYIFKMSF